MTEEALRETIAKNIAFYRKQSGQTQAELAEKLNYSDKSVSKWERGDGTPDVYVLTLLADIFGVGVDDLLKSEPPKPSRLPDRILMTLLGVCLVWLVASVVYFAMRLIRPDFTMAWMSFIFALPVSCIVLTVFTTLWWSPCFQCLSVSGLIWSMALSVHLITSSISEMPLIYIVTGVLQVLVILLYLLKSRRKRRKL